MLQVVPLACMQQQQTLPHEIHIAGRETKLFLGEMIGRIDRRRDGIDQRLHYGFQADIRLIHQIFPFRSRTSSRPVIDSIPFTRVSRTS